MQTERPSARSSPARGVALIVTALVLGLFVLRNGFDNGSSSDDSAQTVAEATNDASPAGDEGGGGGDQGANQGNQGGGDTTEQPPPRPPGEVTVRVVNGSGVTGAAGRHTDDLAGGGYQTVAEGNAPNPVEATQVLFVEGFDREAATLARVIGAPGNGVAPMPAQPPVELQGAQILVVLGPDLAGG